jgi:hypothetical protein
VDRQERFEKKRSEQGPKDVEERLVGSGFVDPESIQGPNERSGPG